MRLLSFLLLVIPVAAFGAGIDLAETYSKNSDLQWQWAISSLEKYPWIGTERVLDIGCGDGKITQVVSEIASEGIVVGLDISPKMIAFASSKFAANDHRNLLFMRGNAAELPFQEQFDVVVSFCTLHWVLDQKVALKGIKESLIPGGKALLVLPGASPGNIAPLCAKLARTDKWAPHFPSFPVQRVYFTGEEYEALVLEAGLTPLHIEVTPSVTPFPHKEALIDWLKPLVTFINHLSPQLQRAFLVDLADQILLINPPAADGSIHMHDLKLEVLATKNDS